jgi:hypothetical protein
VRGVVVRVTRKEELLVAFRAAGRRGLTVVEMQGVVGACWRLRLAELCEDGCVFVEHPSRRRRGTTFRWALVFEPPAGAVEDGGVERLFDPPPPVAANGLFGGDVA